MLGTEDLFREPQGFLKEGLGLPIAALGLRQRCQVVEACESLGVLGASRASDTELF